MISTGKRRDQPRQDEDTGLPRENVGGRYLTTFDPALALQIVERLAEGETLNEICKGKPGMPHPTTFRRWMVNNPDLAKAYDVAIRLSATSIEEEALDAARKIAQAQRDGTQVRAIEVKLGQLRWSAERRDPAKYGNKSQINVRVPVQIITPFDLNMPNSKSIPDIYTLDVTQAKTVDAAIKSPEPPKQLVAPAPIDRHPKLKRQLTPADGSKPQVFARVLRGATDADVRTEGDRRSDRESQERPGDSGVYQPRTEEGAAHEQESSGQEQAPKDIGEDIDA